MKRPFGQIFAVFLLSAAPALAQCPPSPDHSQELTALFDAARAAPSEAAAQDASQRMWALWLTAPDEIAQELLDSGMERRSHYDFLGALDALSRLVTYCPHYAEGYNQRAFAHFLRQDYMAALIDLDRALALSPRHLGALTGRALTLMGLGREAEAQDMLAAALELNPWLRERALLKAPDPVGATPEGEDL